MKKQNRTARIAIAILLTLSLALPIFATADTEPAVPKIPIVEAHISGLAEAEALVEAGLDVLRVESDYDRDFYNFIIMAHDFEWEYFAENNIDYTVVQEDATAKVEWRGYEMAAARADTSPITGIPGFPSSTGNINLTIDTTAMFNPEGVAFNEKYGFPSRLGYRAVTEFYGEMNYLAQAYPEFVKLHVVGASILGVPIFALEISSAPGTNDGRPESAHVAGNHAREWSSNEYCMNLAWQLVTQYGIDPQITNILDTTKVWLVPMSNPDGTHWDQTHNPGTWRKNRNPNNGATGNSIGVDLNRNYASGWGTDSGSSGSLSNEAYRGTAPFSEPETRAVREIYTNNQIMTAITGHTFGELILHPSGPEINELARALADINIHMNSASGGSPAGQHDGYVYNSAGTLSFTFEFNSLNFVRPYLGEDVVYGRYGALAPYNDFYGVQRRIPLTYNYTAAGAAFGPPAEEITAPAVFFPEANFNNTSDGVNRFATVAKVQALGAELDGKILLCPRATGADAAQRTANAAVVKAAQALGAVAVVFCGQTSSNSGYENTDYYIGTSNTASIASQSNTNPAANLVGFTGDALDIRIPVSGTTKAMLREYHEWVQKGGENKLTLTALGNSETGGNSILEHYERNVGAFLYNIEAASIYTSYIKGNIYDSAAAGASLVSGASLDLRLDAPSQIQSSNGTQLPANTYVDVRRSHLDAPDGSYSWAVTPSQQRGFSSHFANEGYAVTASANGRYSDTKNVVVADYKALVGNVNFVVPNAIATDFDFGKAWGPVGTVTVPFSTWLPNGTKGVIDGAAVTATVGGLPIAVNSLGGGNYTATFDPADLALGTDSAQLVIDFDGGAAHSAFAADIDFACVYVDLSTDNVSYISEDVNYTVSLRDAVDVLAVELEFTIDGSMLAGKGLEGLNGFGNMNNVLWIYAGDNLWTGTVTLDLPSGTTTGLTDAGPVDVAVFSYTAKNYGNAAMTLTGARAVGLFGDTTKYLTTAVGDGAAISIIAKSKYDLNRDGVVDALDLGIMLLYCGFDCDGADWDALVKVNDAWGNPVTASMCDVNGDGLIDMLDLLDLFIHYTK